MTKCSSQHVTLSKLLIMLVLHFVRCCCCCCSCSSSRLIPIHSITHIYTWLKNYRIPIRASPFMSRHRRYIHNNSSSSPCPASNLYPPEGAGKSHRDRGVGGTTDSGGAQGGGHFSAKGHTGATCGTGWESFGECKTRPCPPKLVVSWARSCRPSIMYVSMEACDPRARPRPAEEHDDRAFCSLGDFRSRPRTLLRCPPPRPPSPL